MRLLQKAQQVLQNRGYLLTWVPPGMTLPANQLDDFFLLAASHLTQRKKEIFFVQIGANDGKSNDPIFPLVRDLGWSGIALEPVPAVFDLLRETYVGVDRVQCINAALGHRSGTATFYTVEDSPSEVTSYRVHQLSSFNLDTILKHEPFVPRLRERLREIQVRTMTFADIREMADRPIDVVQIDTEGFDAEIVRMLDLSASGPQLIQYEHAHLGKADQSDCIDRLVRHGYRIGRTRTDTIAYRLAR